MRNWTHIAAISIGLSATVVPVSHASGGQVIHYAGMSVSVPADWPVYNLDREPWRCVRYDQHAVFLGRANPDAECPAHVVDRTETLQITPPAMGADRMVRPEAPIHLEDVASQQVLVHPTATSGTVVGTYGDNKPLLTEILQTLAPFLPPPVTTPQAEPAPPDLEQDQGTDQGYDQGSDQSPDQETEERPWVSGKGFDTCTTPSLRTMHAWRSAYGVANIYVGGVARACAQPGLTAGWVRAVRHMGYRLIPTYVGPQAPCTRFHNRIVGRYAAAEGSRAAADAVRAAARLGIPPRSPLYYDMEWYSLGNTGCRRAVLSFLDAWTRGIEARGYVSGVYANAGVGIRDLARASGIRRPAAVWFARWDRNPSVEDSPYLPRRLWNPHRRIKQYRGDHHESHGGVRLNVDSNAVDGIVY